ncbi:N-acetylmuramoyl-L-alanine amidase [Tomitella gaofuii]|uniref:N-acetylmuramoyl-L-alanine amidase n=1 Tax=Tomitella gaofuii TaxID=2760083 RepID=UPI0015F9A3FD|nr:N-acetylmuramoyl-L-alanine amidase [Tomitella gaofuii]
MKPDYVEIPRMGNSRSNRWGARIRNFYLHTQEGDGTAEGLAAYLNNPGNSASYHYTVRDGIVVDVVDTDYASWSVLDANSSSINLCFAGSRAAWTREQWLTREDDIAIAAWLAVQDCRKYGFATTVIPPNYWYADGLSDHAYVTFQLGIGNHTDVGDNFPWDVFTHYVDLYTGKTVPEPVVNMIDQEAAVAAAWIGERLTEGENTCPDGVGRWAQFAHGWIYWHPNTGAYAIPTAIFETYADHGWEAGELGYPTGRHTVLHNPDSGEAWGDVQGFERGAIYRRYGQPGHVVKGMIRAYWNRTGFENGPFGWPTSDEQDYGGGRFQDFEHGRLTWSPSSVVGTHAADDFDQIVPEPEGN